MQPTNHMQNVQQNQHERSSSVKLNMTQSVYQISKIKTVKFTKSRNHNECAYRRSIWVIESVPAMPESRPMSYQSHYKNIHSHYPYIHVM